MESRADTGLLVEFPWALSEGHALVEARLCLGLTAAALSRQARMQISGEREPAAPMSEQPTRFVSAPVATHPYAAIDAEGRWLWQIAHMGPELLAEQQRRAAALGGTVIDRRTDPTPRQWAPHIRDRFNQEPRLRASPAARPRPRTHPRVTVGAKG